MITGSGPKGRIVFEGLSADGPAPQICHLRLELQVLFLLCTFVLFLLCSFVLFLLCTFLLSVVYICSVFYLCSIFWSKCAVSVRSYFQSCLNNTCGGWKSGRAITSLEDADVIMLIMIMIIMLMLSCWCWWCYHADADNKANMLIRMLMLSCWCW